MLDLRLIRSDPDAVRAALARRKADGPLDELLALDERRRALQTQADELRAERNRASQAIGEAKRAGRDAAAEQAQAARPRRPARRALDGELVAPRRRRSTSCCSRCRTSRTRRPPTA